MVLEQIYLGGFNELNLIQSIGPNLEKLGRQGGQKNIKDVVP